MYESYHIYSKVLVKAKPGSFIMRILLDICLVIYLLACAVLVFFEGIGTSLAVTISIAGSACLVVYIVIMFNRRPSAREHYETVPAEIRIEVNTVSITYYQISTLNGGSITYVIPADRISAIEYDDINRCVYIRGCFKVTYKGSRTKTENMQGCSLYLDKNCEGDVLKALSVAHKIGGILNK